MAGLGAGAGAAERMMFDDKMAEERHHFNARMAADRRKERAAERQQQWANARAEKLDAAALAQQSLQNARIAQKDQQAFDQQQWANARAEKLDAAALAQQSLQNARMAQKDQQAFDQQQWANARAEKLDAQNLEQRNLQNQRAARQDEWAEIFNKQKQEQFELQMKQNALMYDEYKAKIDDSLNKYRQQKELATVNNQNAVRAIYDLQGLADPMERKIAVDAVCQSMGEGWNFDDFSIAGNTILGIQFEKDGKGNVLFGQDGKPVIGAGTRVMNPDMVAACMSAFDQSFDPIAGRYVQRGSTAGTQIGRTRNAGGAELDAAATQKKSAAKNAPAPEFDFDGANAYLDELKARLENEKDYKAREPTQKKINALQQRIEYEKDKRFGLIDEVADGEQGETNDGSSALGAVEAMQRPEPVRNANSGDVQMPDGKAVMDRIKNSGAKFNGNDLAATLKLARDGDADARKWLEAQKEKAISELVVEDAKNKGALSDYELRLLDKGKAN